MVFNASQDYFTYIEAVSSKIVDKMGVPGENNQILRRQNDIFIIQGYDQVGFELTL